MTEQTTAGLKRELSGIDQLLTEFEQEQTLNDRIQTLSLAVVCLLNDAGRRATAQLASLKEEKTNE